MSLPARRHSVSTQPFAVQRFCDRLVEDIERFTASAFILRFFCVPFSTGRRGDSDQSRSKS